MAWSKSKYKELGGHWQDYRGEHKVWQHMIDRCTKPENIMYRWYGGRGIRVCDKWLSEERGFINFYHDMGPRPRDEKGKPFQIDRIDNDGDYHPENCRWASNRENARNRSDNIYCHINGERMCVAGTCNLFHINRTTVSERVRLRGQDPDSALIQVLINKGYELSPAKGGK